MCPSSHLLGRTRLLKLSAILFLLFNNVSVASSSNKVCTITRATEESHHDLHYRRAANSSNMDSGKLDVQNREWFKKIKHGSVLQSVFKLLDAGFFNDTKVLEIEKGAMEFNIPIIRANRKLVASVNGG
ncbi:hypothetical protein ACH5RR_024751 [Cinchona calisaya]|uniref:Uncharacterized protein n=1 Tax=Cinchona calisaya TaxID=153742 RepID=A0ABD2Z0A3_9GENT